jgi:hypothetical protein
MAVGDIRREDVLGAIALLDDPSKVRDFSTNFTSGSVCLSVRNSNLFRAELRTFANFDLEDSDDLAALLGKRYGLCVALGCTSRLYAVSIALDR